MAYCIIYVSWERVALTGDHSKGYHIAGNFQGIYSATSLKSKFLNFWDYDVLCEVSLELKVTKRPDLVRM